eukprot:14288329-Heterocapsa_arctica.AAC.1
MSAALTLRADGKGPVLQLPTVWNYEDPDGYYQSVVKRRLEERAQRVWWDFTHKAQVSKSKQGQGTEDPNGPPPPEGRSRRGRDRTREPATVGPEPIPAGSKTATAPYPAGKPVSPQELGLARQHAPLCPKGTMKCWDWASHMGCKAA